MKRIQAEIKVISKLLESYELIDVGGKSRKYNQSEDSTKWEGWNVERFELEEEGDK